MYLPAKIGSYEQNLSGIQGKNFHGPIFRTMFHNCQHYIQLHTQRKEHYRYYTRSLTFNFKSGLHRYAKNVSTYICYTCNKIHGNCIILHKQKKDIFKFLVVFIFVPENISGLFVTKILSAVSKIIIKRLIFALHYAPQNILLLDDSYHILFILPFLGFY